MKMNFILLQVSSSRDLGSVQYRFVAITQVCHGMAALVRAQSME